MYHYVTWMYHTFVPLHLATLHLLHCIWSPCICHIALVILYLAHWICKFESHERPLNTSWRLKNVSWSPSDCIINFPPISFLYDLNVTWKYHECHLNVLQMSPECECVRNFTQGFSLENIDGVFLKLRPLENPCWNNNCLQIISTNKK